MKLFVIVAVASLCCLVYAKNKCPDKKYQKHDFTMNARPGTVKVQGDSRYGSDGIRVRVACTLEGNKPFRLSDLQVQFFGTRLGKGVGVFENEFTDKAIENQELKSNQRIVKFEEMKSDKILDKVVVEARCLPDDNEPCTVKIVDLKACSVE